MLNGNHRVVEYFESYFVNFSPDYFDGRFEWLITESYYITDKKFENELTLVFESSLIEVSMNVKPY